MAQEILPFAVALTRRLLVLLTPTFIIIDPVPEADPTFAKEYALPFCATIDKHWFVEMHEK